MREGEKKRVCEVRKESGKKDKKMREREKD